MWTSYAQNFEDVILLRAFSNIEGGVYIDVGAQDPVLDSVSLAFYERGWRGVHVEPIPEFAERLRQARPDETVIQAVIRSGAGPMTFYSVADSGLSTGDPELAAAYAAEGRSVQPIMVEARSLSSVLDGIRGGVVHWMKIDVEGMERTVLESWGDSPIRPWVLVVESTRPNSAQASHQSWEPLVERLGYEFVYFDGLNRFYVSAEHPEIRSSFGAPPNYFDDFNLSDHSLFTRSQLVRLRQDAEQLKAAAQEREALNARIGEFEVLVREEQGRVAALAGKLSRAQRRLDAAEARVVSLSRGLAEEGSRAESLARLLAESQHVVAEMRRSQSWRLTAPLRGTMSVLRVGVRGASAWLLLREGSRPRRIARSLTGRMRLAASPAVGRPVPDSRPPFYVLVGHTVDCSTNTGVQRVVRGLCKALVEDGRAATFVKWDDDLNACVPIDADQRARLGSWNGPAPTAVEAGLYPPKSAPPRALHIAPDSDGWLIVPEVPHMSFGARPVTARLAAWARTAGLKSGFVFYDAIPLRRPEFASMAPIHAQYMDELRQADAVWPISRWSADDLVSFFGEAAEEGSPKIEPVHLPPEFDRPRVLQPLPGEKLILSVGTIEPRKNQVALIRVFQEILVERGAGWRLVLAGNLHPLVAAEVDKAAAPGTAIEFRGHVPDAELSGLYRSCAFTVFPSVEEGYGLPILESLWQGKPCLCADFGAMAEVAAGGGCLTVDVRDPVALKAGLERLMDDSDLRERLTAEAIDRDMPRWSDYVGALSRLTASRDRFIYYWVDATVATPVNTGIQRVVRQLARALLEAGFRLIPVKWGGPTRPLCPVSQEELEHFALWNGPEPRCWSSWREPRPEASGWFLMGELPLQYTDEEQKMFRAAAEAANLKTAAVFYDTIPWKMRDVYPKVFANAHRLYIAELQHYDRVVAISRYSQHEMIKVLREDLNVSGPFGNILASPLPAEFPERSPEIEVTPTADAGDRSVEILCVGTVEPRKNHELMLEAFEIAAHRSTVPLRLVLAGGSHSIEPDLAVRVRAWVEGNPAMTWEEKADDTRIRELYRRCHFTIYPSVEEGFGMPIVESLWYGKPAICAAFGAMAEVAEEGGCVMVDVTDVEAMAKAICELAASPARRAELAAEARRRTFSTWSDYALDVAHKLDLWTKPNAEAVRVRRQDMGLRMTPASGAGNARKTGMSG